MTEEYIDVHNVNNPTWMERSLCRQFPSEWWLAEDSNNHNAKHAKKICNDCEVKKDCLNWILELERDQYGVPGIYAGTTQKDRFAIRYCKFPGCENKVQRVNTTPRAQNNFCSVEHQKENERLRIKRFHDKELNNQTDYYMKGIVHG